MHPEHAGPGIDLGASNLFRLTDRLYRSRSLSDAYEAALDAIVDMLGVGRASILLFDADGVMRFVASRGLSDAYRAAVDGHTPWQPGERDPDPIFVPDIRLTDESDTLKQTILGEGIVGLAFVPLVASGRTVGKFMMYYPQAHAFSDREREIAITIARQLGFTLERALAEQARVAAEQQTRNSEERFRLMSEDAPIMIWIADKEGRCLHLNRMLRAFWGVREADTADFDWRTTMHPEDRPAITDAMVNAVSRHEQVTTKGRFRRADGAMRVLETFARPNFGAGGEFEGMIGVNVDVTEREEAELALRESEERQRIAVFAAGLGVFEWNLVDDTTIWGNSRMYEIFGRDPNRGPVPHQTFLNTCIHGDDRAGFVEAIARGTLAEGPFHATCRAVRESDGKVRWIEMSGRFEISGDGEPRRLVGVVADVSDRRKAEEHKRLLINELNHRVKNTLAVVQSIARQTFRGDGSDDTRIRAFSGRLAALAQTHNLLSNENWERASLEDVARRSLTHNGAADRRIRIGGPLVELQPKQALTTAMALHELYTNAVKYGALRTGDGTVSFTWEVSPGENARMRMRWQEESPVAIEPPRRKGFGSTMIEQALGAELSADVAMDFLPGGLVCTVSAPVPVMEDGHAGR